MDSNMIWAAVGFGVGAVTMLFALFTYSLLRVSSVHSRAEEAEEWARLAAQREEGGDGR